MKFPRAERIRLLHFSNPLWGGVGGHALPHSFDKTRNYEVTGCRDGGKETRPVFGFYPLGLAE